MRAAKRYGSLKKQRQPDVTEVFYRAWFERVKRRGGWFLSTLRRLNIRGNDGTGRIFFTSIAVSPWTSLEESHPATLVARSRGSLLIFFNPTIAPMEARCSSPVTFTTSRSAFTRKWHGVSGIVFQFANLPGALLLRLHCLLAR